MFANFRMEIRVMATLKFFLDTRAIKPESSAPLKIQLTHNRQVSFIALNIKLRPDQWDAVSLSVKNHPQKNNFLELHNISRKYFHLFDTILIP